MKVKQTCLGFILVFVDWSLVIFSVTDMKKRTVLWKTGKRKLNSSVATMDDIIPSNASMNTSGEHQHNASVPTICDVTIWQCKSAVLLYRYAPPILIVVGTIGNFIAVVTLQSRMFKSSSTSFILSVLAIFDVGVLNCDLLRNWLIGVYNIDIKGFNEFGCKVHTFGSYFFNHVASWSLILLTLERTPSVCSPLKCKEIWSRRRMVTAWLGVVAILAVLNLHLFFSKELVRDDPSAPILTGSGLDTTFWIYCTVTPAWRSFFFVYWAWIDAFIGDVIPFGIIICGNVIIAIKLIQAKRQRSKQVAMSFKKNNGKTVQSTTVTLILVSVAFLVLNMPLDMFSGSTIWAWTRSRLRSTQRSRWSTRPSAFSTTATAPPSSCFISSAEASSEERSSACSVATTGRPWITNWRNEETRIKYQLACGRLNCFLFCIIMLQV